jgi:radical SAM superfamily enzyme YgiQ (UPF0313 family)
MKVLLAYPFFLFDRADPVDIQPLPMGMHYLGAALIRAGFEVRLADWHQAHQDPEIVRRELADFTPDVLGLSVFHANRFGGLDLATFAKRLCPGLTTVFGGPGATFLHQMLALNQCVDYVVRGEGEETFAALLAELAAGNDPAGMAGVTARTPQGPVAGPCAPRIEDLDSLAMPAAHYTFQHLSLSRGCPGKCAFCGSPRFWGPRVRFHSAGYFVEQMQLLREKGVDFFYVSDDTFTLKKDLVLEVCSLIRQRCPGVTWAAISRVDRFDLETARTMRAAGCIQVSFGVESGSKKIRRRLGKTTTDDQIRKAFAAAHQAGILARAYIIYGCPGETEEDVRASMDLLAEIQPLVTLFHVLQVFPGTALWEQVSKEFGIGDEIWRQRSEDILYCQADPALSPGTVQDRGRRLKEAFFGQLSGYDPEAAPLDEENAYHLSGFLARAGLTFTHGDYAGHPGIRNPARIGRRLLEKGLRTAGHPRAYRGLGLVLAETGNRDQAREILQQGIRAFPEDQDLKALLASLGGQEGDG